MALTNYIVTARSTGTPTPGLTPTFNAFRKVSTGADLSGSAPAITGLGGGLYQFAYDPEGTNGEAAGVLDFGAGITDPNERYADVACLLPLVSMSQAYPVTPTAGTVGEALAFTDATKRALVPYSGTITDASSTTTILDTSLNTVAGNKDITGDQLVFSTGANSNEEARYIIGYYFSAGSTYGNVTGLTTAGQVLVDVAYPAAPANTDTFVLLTDGNGKKLYNVLTNAVGTDNKLLLSANAQTGVTIPTVTTVAGLSALIGTPAVSLAADIAGVPTALLDLANGVETGITFRQFCRLMMAVNSGLATETAGTVTFNRKDGTTVALTVVHTSTGTRTASTIGTL